MYKGPSLRVLLVDDDLAGQIAFQRAVNDQGLPYQYIVAESLRQARQLLTKQEIDVVVSACDLADGDIVDMLDTMTDRDIPVVVTIKYGQERSALRAIKNGADGFIIKDQERNYIQLLAVTIERALHFRSAVLENQRFRDQVRYLKTHDSLTGLYSRPHFETVLKDIDDLGQLPFCLIIGDLNGLKLINDALGNKEGDRLVAEAAAVLKRACRPQDTVARWGGDEFIILLPGCDAQAGSQTIEKIQELCRNDDDMPIGISLTLGLASKESSAQDLQEIIKDAEDDMQETKLLESNNILSSFIESLERTLWTRSHETEEHCRQVQEMALRLGYMVNLCDEDLKNLKLLAVLHDIGKIAIPNSMLNKPGKCSPEEWENLKKHPEIGYRLALSSPELAPIAEAILFHHEHWDGQGYPIGLRGEEIPILSRIVALVDAYNVLVHGRPYQKPISPEKAWQEIARCAGSQFDPELVRKALELSGYQGDARTGLNRYI